MRGTSGTKSSNATAMPDQRDRSFENQRHMASGLDLIVTAIMLWNTICLERAASLLARYQPLIPSLLQRISALGWEHVNLTGDCTWHSNKRVAKSGFRPLRIPSNNFGVP
jgi:Tn3 transposase DDE domain